MQELTTIQYAFKITGNEVLKSAQHPKHEQPICGAEQAESGTYCSFTDKTS